MGIWAPLSFLPLPLLPLLLLSPQLSPATQKRWKVHYRRSNSHNLHRQPLCKGQSATGNKGSSLIGCVAPPLSQELDPKSLHRRQKDEWKRQKTAETAGKRFFAECVCNDKTHLWAQSEYEYIINDVTSPGQRDRELIKTVRRRLGVNWVSLNTAEKKWRSAWKRLVRALPSRGCIASTLMRQRGQWRSCWSSWLNTY